VITGAFLKTTLCLPRLFSAIKSLFSDAFTYYVRKEGNDAKKQRP
jgi:hypothetical protein